MPDTPHAPDISEDAAVADPTASADATSEAQPQPSAGRGILMRRALLHKLPQLEHEAQSQLSGIKLDRDGELLDAVQLDVDAFLTPLATTRRKERR